MKLICDIIYNDPVKIQVGHVLTLNKRLLLAVLIFAQKSFVQKFNSFFDKNFPRKKLTY